MIIKNKLIIPDYNILLQNFLNYINNSNFHEFVNLNYLNYKLLNNKFDFKLKNN